MKKAMMTLLMIWWCWCVLAKGKCKHTESTQPAILRWWLQLRLPVASPVRIASQTKSFFKSASDIQHLGCRGWIMYKNDHQTYLYTCTVLGSIFTYSRECLNVTTIYVYLVWMVLKKVMQSTGELFRGNQSSISWSKICEVRLQGLYPIYI